MTISHQKVLSLSVKKLKSLENCEIPIGDSLTAIMGTNCSGKTTVLHSLACAFKPGETGGDDWRFPNFFRPSTDSPWTGSEYTVCYQEKEGDDFRKNECQVYKKDVDRWSPRQLRRPERQVTYLMVKDSVPEVEVVTGTGRVKYTKRARSDASSCLLYTSPSPRDGLLSRMPSSA